MCAGGDSVALVVSDGAAGGHSHADSDNWKTEHCSPFSAMRQRNEQDGCHSEAADNKGGLLKGVVKLLSG